MKVLVVFAVVFTAFWAMGQEIGSNTPGPAASAYAEVPRLIQFSGVAKDINGQPMKGTIGITFLLYSEEQGGAPLWMETQYVQADAKGHYSVQLGATRSEGLPAELFGSNEARWLAVQAEGQPEQPRVAVLSVPYALKAADAETLGGKPASAFMLAGAPNVEPLTAHSDKPDTATAEASGESADVTPNLTGTGITDFIPIWISSTKLGDSALFQTGGKVGINTTTPSDTFTVVSPNQLGVSIQAPVSGVGAGLDMQTTGTGGVLWELLATGNTSAQGTGKLNIRDVNTGQDIFTITGSGNVGIDTTDPTAGLYIIANNKVAAFLNNNDAAGTLFVQQDSTANGATIFEALASPSGNGCSIGTNGDLGCTGSKSAIVPVDDGRMVALYAVEAPDNWFEDYGGGKLENGTARIALEPTFAQTVNTEMTYRVFLTPKGDCQGLYVSNESPQGFEVHELRGAHSNVEFDYRIIARRKGYENIRLADKTESMAASRGLMRPASGAVAHR